MSKKDYELLADALRSVEAPLSIINAIGIALQKDNPSFDIDRFKDRARGRISQTKAYDPRKLADRLIEWAQNEEMVDTGFTSHGKLCLEAATFIRSRA